MSVFCFAAPALTFGPSVALCISYSLEDRHFMPRMFPHDSMLIQTPVNIICALSLCRNEYLCFQKVMKGEYVVPDGFPDQGTDLVKSLLVRSS